MTPDNNPAGPGRPSLQAWAGEAQAAVAIARQMVGTAFVPDALKVWADPDTKLDLDEQATVQTVAMVLLAGQELTFPPMASLRAITIIKNTVGLYALAARALLLQAGHDIEVRESTSTRAIVDGRRAGGEWQRSTWDLERATTARLYPGGANSSWRTQTKAMLVARATAEASRWVAADALLALPLMAEEIEAGLTSVQAAIEAGDQARALADGDAGEPERTTRRKRQPGKRAELPSGPPAPIPPEGTEPKAPEPPPPPAEPAITKVQRKNVVAGLTAIGKGTPEGAAEFLTTELGRDIENTGQLTRDEADRVLARIDAIKALTPAAPPEGDPGPGEGAEPLPGMPPEPEQ